MAGRMNIGGVMAAGLVGAAAAAAVLSGRLSNPAVASSPAMLSEVAPTRLATCDVYSLVERLVETDQFAPVRKAEEDRLKKLLEPMELDLMNLQKELQAADPKDPAAQAKYQAFQGKQTAYQAERQKAAETYSALVAEHFKQSYRIAADASKKIATELGFTHVIAQKSGDVMAKDPQRLVEEFLSRPMVATPADTDITEKVRVSLKLPEKAATPAAAPAAGDAKPAEEKK